MMQYNHSKVCSKYGRNMGYLTPYGSTPFPVTTLLTTYQKQALLSHSKKFFPDVECWYLWDPTSEEYSCRPTINSTGNGEKFKTANKTGVICQTKRRYFQIDFI